MFSITLQSKPLSRCRMRCFQRWDLVMGVRKPDGTLTWISVNSQPLYKADGTMLNGVVASFEDITERRKTEEALRQATAELEWLRERIKHVPEKVS
jgi:PAS domain-containing protein